MTEGNCPGGYPYPQAELQVFMRSVAVMIWDTLVNTQTDRQTDRLAYFERFYTISSIS